MATLRRSRSIYDLGQRPPVISWTFVRGDTASFRVYVADDDKQPLELESWAIRMKVKRPDTLVNVGRLTDPASLVITDDASLIYDILPAPDEDDRPGEFTVFLSSAQTKDLQTGDIFDIEVSALNDDIVWTVCQGRIIVLEDVTD
jgi:hypothetical protein